MPTPVLQLSLCVSSDGSEESTSEFMTSKFHFVDLAGSERVKRTGAEGKR